MKALLKTIVVLFIAVAISVSIPQSAIATQKQKCTKLPMVALSSDVNENTKLGGHLTSHIYTTRPQRPYEEYGHQGKTLWKNEQDWYDDYAEFANSKISCDVSPQEGYKIEVTINHKKPIEIYYCNQQDSQGVCSEYTTRTSEKTKYILRGVKYQHREIWIVLTAFPKST